MKSFLVSSFGLFVVLGLTGCLKETQQASSLKEEIVKPVESVAALGQLSPYGEVRRLAAPLSSFGGTPRVSKLLIKEGDVVTQGQILAVFDSQPKIISDLSSKQVRYKTLTKNISYQLKDISRYQQAALKGAFPIALLEEKKDELLKLEGQRDEILAEITGLKSELRDSQLLSPIDGMILKVNTRVGERPGLEGVLEVGASQLMQALVEVYESDISRIRVGQSVSLISENGGFDEILLGTVERISPQVRQRKVLSTDPTGDADARVVEVRVKLLPNYIKSVSHLTGIKVIAKFKPE
ncbi:HlyD family efflux transporter periplasmic adaptor subunit [Prochlorococcus sp. MIT 1223]|uniref:HlyD family efflux transporter periplasmic adaptor subunit n=1 Tax=Prochlorococcus sp. MIT 1223 TaxID=3096217 RepID=UPI002A7611E0|nr:HlyD family efflux transporter periplasmic adaptor subunit [Prochlorococcus sp. MIT 1223]